MPIFKRVSCREFTDQKVSKSDLELILRAAMQAPSARNQQPWEFLIEDGGCRPGKAGDLAGTVGSR